MIKVNELYYPVDVDVDFNIGISGAFAYEHFDSYGDRKGESEGIPNTIETTPRNALKKAIARQAISYSDTWGYAPTKLSIANGNLVDEGTITTTATQSGNTVTWSLAGLVCLYAQGSYTPVISLKAGNDLIASSQPSVVVTNAQTNDTFDLTYTFNFSYTQWETNNPFLQNVCRNNATSKSDISRPWIGRSDHRALLDPWLAVASVNDYQYKIYGDTGITTLSGYGAAADYTLFGVGQSTKPWFSGSSAAPFAGLGAKRVRVTLTWTVG